MKRLLLVLAIVGCAMLGKTLVGVVIAAPPHKHLWQIAGSSKDTVMVLCPKGYVMDTFRITGASGMTEDAGIDMIQVSCDPH